MLKKYMAAALAPLRQAFRQLSQVTQAIENNLDGSTPVDRLTQWQAKAPDLDPVSQGIILERAARSASLGHSGPSKPSYQFRAARNLLPDTGAENLLR